METSTIQRIKDRAGRLIEDRVLQTGRVLEVRPWTPCSMVEIDLHLPSADMSQWTEVPYMKFKVAGLTYRDYTPSRWDAETQTCTLFIDTGHDGPGSRWARSLKQGDVVGYFKEKTTHHHPSETAGIVALGDASSLGHLLALEQMTMPSGRFSGAILMDEDNHHALLPEYFNLNLQPLKRQDEYGHHTLMNWLNNTYGKLSDTMFYITGNNILVDRLRKLLRENGYHSDQMRIKGFWS